MVPDNPAWLRTGGVDRCFRFLTANFSATNIQMGNEEDNSAPADENASPPVSASKPLVDVGTMGMVGFVTIALAALVGVASSAARSEPSPEVWMGIYGVAGLGAFWLWLAFTLTMIKKPS